MPNVHTTLTSLFSAIANAIRGKTGSSAQIVADDFPDAIDAIPTGTPLPPLTDPASASDILDGKEAILPDANDEPIVVTGTLVPPIDTGANGLYKAMIEGNAEYINDDTLKSTVGWRAKNAVSIILKEVETVSSFESYTTIETFVAPKLSSQMPTRIFYNCTNLKNVWCPIATGATGFDSTSNQRHFAECRNIEHLYLGGWKYVGFLSFDQPCGVKTLTFDNIVSVSGLSLPALDTLIIRNTSAALYRVGDISQTLIASGNGYIYVPSTAVADYKARTNWTTYASQIIGIDEDTTTTVGTLFTPTTSATVDHWDQVDLQSYSVGTIDTTNGSITPTHDGRLLIRGLDSSDNIVHVTYLQIGTGFDEAQNLLENL